MGIGQFLPGLYSRCQDFPRQSAGDDKFFVCLNQAVLDCNQVGVALLHLFFQPVYLTAQVVKHLFALLDGIGVNDQDQQDHGPKAAEHDI